MKNNIPPLPPITSQWIHRIADNYDLQKELIDTYESPLNIHHLESFKTNLAEYRSILNAYDFKSKIYYARKANKCSTLASVAFENGFGIDTASYTELRQCLDLNINPQDLVVTAAIKNDKLLRLAITNRVLIIIDNKDEADLILKIAKEENCQAQVGFRVSGFEYKDHKLKSRFGFDIDEVGGFIIEFFNSEEVTEYVNFEGFHFHLDGYDPQQRGAALHQTLDLIETLITYDFNPSFVDIGGGILMNYLEEADFWIEFQKQLKKAVLEKREAITYQNNGLGFNNRNGEIEGGLKTYPYYNDTTKEEFLKNVLEIAYVHRKPVSYRLQELDIELRLEPGRSLLDQVGVTIARVAHRKKDVDGNFLVGLEMNMTQMASSSEDFLLDPIVSYKNRKTEEESVEVYFTGAYCLERDFILKRKISLPKLPEIGDFVIFINTAGYMMHFFETEAHLFKLSQNVFVNNVEDKISLLDFYRDENNLETKHIYL